MKALLVVDVQKDLVDRKLFQKERFIERIEGTIRKFREMNQLVVFIQHNNSFLKYGTDAWKISEKLVVEKSDPIVQKKHGNAFEKTDLKGILNEHHVNEVVICGLVSHGCVRATSIGAKNEGLDVKLLKNGHSNWAKDAEDKIQKVESELEKKGILVIEEGL